MLIVVTGASGFVGRHVSAFLTARSHEVIRAARPGPDRTGVVPLEAGARALREALRRRPDVLIHAAGTAQVSESFDDPCADFASNVDLYLDVLEAVRDTAPRCRVALVSSAAVYGDPQVLPIGEDAPIAPVSPYGHHKAIAEQLGVMYHQVFGLATCSARIFSAYGRGLRRQVVYDAIQKFQTAHAGAPAVFRGTGDEARDFIHVEDVARGIDTLVRGADWTGEAYNLASGEATSIADLVATIRDELGSQAPVVFDGLAARGYPLVWRADVSRLQRLGFVPAWNLRRGIGDVAAHWTADHAALAGGHV
ncbi:MAG: NAD-dependent epimerase/dehydratase family protein [Chloroflexi bacterium]|nr:NAD-dependent epimerase/dehydratase family protein [Chloroflexota bacterium]